MALACAKGQVENKFKKLHRNVTGVVGFVNILDVYEYIGAANITIQNQFGFQYLKDFLGFNTIFLLGEDEVARGKILATPVENIVLYYVDPNDSDFVRAGLDYTTGAGETNLIGFHTQGNYATAVSEAFAIMGLTLFAEYIDAIAVVTVESGYVRTTTLTLNKTTATVAAAATTSITATKSATSTGTVKWTSSNTDVATVSAGTVTGVAAGTAVITASLDDFTASCTVTVTES